MDTYKERLNLFTTLLSPTSPSYTFPTFREYCFYGIPDHPSIRPKAWKILLGYLPYHERHRWNEILEEKRGVYFGFVGDLGQDSLNDSTDSKEVEEMMILEQIDKDVRRTLPDLSFFQRPIPGSRHSPLHPGDKQGVKTVSPVQSRRALFRRLGHLYGGEEFGARTRQILSAKSPGEGEKEREIPAEDDEQEDLHWEALERILFIYAKLNPGIGYVQGMNEILAPLYYVLANDSDEESRAHAEPDTFFLFTSLLSEFRDHFIRSLDNVAPTSRSTSLASLSSETVSIPLTPSTGTGIGNSMERLMKRLRKLDVEVWRDLKLKQIQPTYFAFRWLTCLLTQEFALPEVIRLWDSVLADLAVDICGDRDTQCDTSPREGKFEFLIDICCAMIICIRNSVLTSNFADTIKLLQHYPLEDVTQILEVAYGFRRHSLSHDQSGDSPHSDAMLFARVLRRSDGILSRSEEEEEEKRRGGWNRLLYRARDTRDRDTDNEKLKRKVHPIDQEKKKMGMTLFGLRMPTLENKVGDTKSMEKESMNENKNNKRLSLSLPIQFFGSMGGGGRVEKQKKEGHHGNTPGEVEQVWVRDEVGE